MIIKTPTGRYINPEQVKALFFHSSGTEDGLFVTMIGDAPQAGSIMVELLQISTVGAKLLSQHHIEAKLEEMAKLINDACASPLVCVEHKMPVNMQHAGRFAVDLAGEDPEVKGDLMVAIKSATDREEPPEEICTSSIPCSGDIGPWCDGCEHSKALLSRVVPIEDMVRGEQV